MHESDWQTIINVSNAGGSVADMLAALPHCNLHAVRYMRKKLTYSGAIPPLRPLRRKREWLVTERRLLIQTVLDGGGIQELMRLLPDRSRPAIENYRTALVHAGELPPMRRPKG